MRERRTNQGDIKITYQVAANDLVSVRYSKQNASTNDPATFGIFGGLKPFAGTGTNPTQSVGGTYNRVWSATLVQEVRFGRTHHHNEAIAEDYGLNDLQRFRHQGREPERLHERHHDDQCRRLQRLPDRLRDVAAVGS